MRNTKILLSIALFATVCLFAQNTTTIYGTVVEEKTGKAIHYAQVVLVGTEIGTTTDKDGRYYFDGVAPGEYQVKATMMGYLPNNKKVEIFSDSEVATNFALQSTILKGDEVIVGATKMEKTIKNIGGTVYMIPESELRQTDSRNIQDVLTRVPGVFAQDKFHNEHNVITFRGVGLHTYVTRGILVLIDGIAVNEAMGRSIFEGINLENAERIEILKGPVSALYGPNGVTGVINVITKSPPAELSGSFNYTNGAYNSQRYSTQVGKTFGKTGLYANALVYSSDGYMDYNTYDTKKFSTRLSSETDSFGNFDLIFDYSKSKVDYPGSLSREQYENDEKAGSNKFAGSDKDLIRTGVKNLLQLNEFMSVTTNVYFRSRFDKGHYMDIRYGESDLSLYGGEVQLNSSLFNNNVKYVIGASHDQETGISKTYNRDGDGIIGDLIGDGKSIYNIRGVYAQTDLSFFDGLTAIFGMRYDNVSYDWKDRFDTEYETATARTNVGALSPKVSLAYNPVRSLTLFGNWGRGFNPPDIDQLFGSDTDSNPDLKPEYLTNYEIGVRGDIGYRIKYQVSAFKMDFVDQVIKDEETGVYDNIGDTEHSGIETSLNAMLTKDMMMYFNYAYLNAVFVDHPTYNNNTLVRTPKNQLGVGIRMNLFSHINASLDYKWFDKYYMDNEEVNLYDGHGLLNAKIRYDYKKFNVAVSVDNVLDSRYAASASARYTITDYRTREYGWVESFYPGWPRNYNITFGINF